MRRLVHSRYVTILDQVVSSLSNFALVAFVANVTAPADFGRFSLGYVVLLFFLGFQRSLVGEVLLVRYSDQREQPAGTFGAAAGVPLVVGVLSAASIAVTGWVTGGPASLWWALAVAGPIAFVQDIARYVLIARKLSGYALVSDAAWLLLSIPVMWWLVQTDAAATSLVLVWVGGALVAAVVALLLARLLPRPVQGMRWLATNRDLAIRFSAEYSSLNLSNTVVWFALTGPVGVAGVAALRGASLVFSPLNTGFNAVRIAVIPELVRATGTRRYGARMRETALILLALAVGWSVAVLVLPDDWGRLLLGDTWSAAADLRLPYAVQAVAMVAYTVILAHYRASALHRASTRMRAVLAALTLALPVVLSLVLHAAGAAWGFAIAVAGAVVVAAVSEIRRRRSA